MLSVVHDTTLDPDVLALEDEYTDDVSRRLGDVFDRLQVLFASGPTREVALHLVFLAFFLTLEPEHLTGADPARHHPAALRAAATTALAHLAPDLDRVDDPELALVLEVMFHLAPYAFGDAEAFSARADVLETRRRQSGTVDPAVFRGRGWYGAYFEGQAEVFAQG